MDKLQIVKEKIKDTDTLFFVLIILAGFTIYKTFFNHFGILVFIFISTLLVVFLWNYKKSYVTLVILEKIKKLPYWTAIFTIAAYSLIVLPFEYLMTEVWYKTARFPQYLTVLSLVLLGFVFSFINWKKILSKRLNIVIACLILLLSTISYLKYNKEKLSREYLPKIYRISPTWGVQAQIIKLEGINFGPVWKGGKIFIGGAEAIIKQWSDNLIVVEQPVTAPFGRFNLKIIRDDGIETNYSLPYEVRNPNSL